MVAAAIVLLLIAVLLSLRFTESIRLQAWAPTCLREGGRVEAVEPKTRNPLLAESDQPTYDCRSAAGEVSSRWR